MSAGWAVERQFDIATNAPHVASSGAPRILLEASPQLRMKLATAAVVQPTSRLRSFERVDFTIVSDAGVLDALGNDLRSDALVDAMLERLDRLDASAHGHAGRVFWIETALLEPRELDRLESACDILVLPEIDSSGNSSHRVVCNGLLDLRAMEASSPPTTATVPEASAPVLRSTLEDELWRLLHPIRTPVIGTESASASAASKLAALLVGDAALGGADEDGLATMRSVHVWTPRRLLARLGDLLGAPHPSTESVTVVTRVASSKEAHAAAAFFRQLPPTIAERLVMVIDDRVPSDAAMSMVRSFGSPTTVVTPIRELATPEGRAGLIGTAYAALMPSGVDLDVERLASALAIVEAAHLPIALGAVRGRATLSDRTTTPLLMSPEHALRAVRSGDRLLPARGMGLK